MHISPKLLLKLMSTSLMHTTGYYLRKCSALNRSGNTCILMYHRIVSPEKISEYVEPGMYVTPETFEMHCKVLKKHFCVVSLSDLISGNIEKNAKPVCAITFDDGWKDFYQNAFPILSRYECPATVFLPTRFIGSSERFWTDHLAKLLSEQRKSTEHEMNTAKYRQLTKAILQLNGTLFKRTDEAIKLLKKLPLDQIQFIISELKHIRGTTHFEGAFLSWDDVRELKKTGLIEFGSHTVNHLILPAEDDATIRSELIESKKKLIDEQAANDGSISFCYPNGGFTIDIANLVEQSGYFSAVTTKRGWNCESSKRFTLNRIGIHEDISFSAAMFFSRISQ